MPIPKKPPTRSLEIANATAAVQDRPHLYRGPFLYQEGGTPAEYKAGLDLAIARGWLEIHESGTYVRFTQAGAVKATM
jgi:hypothetical protein